MLKKCVPALIVLPLTFGSLLGSGGSQNFVSPFQGQYLLAQKELSLGNRIGNNFVNDVFKKNILLNLAYLSNRVSNASDIKWDEITKPFSYEFLLNPNQTFAFHEDIAEKYQKTLAKTTNAHFNAREGFKTDGYLFGGGVCHLASLLNWAAKDAGLLVEAPTNHNFANIPDIPKEYGVSIYSSPLSKGSNTLQNLYITNNKNKPVAFKFEYYNDKVKVSVAGLN